MIYDRAGAINCDVLAFVEDEDVRGSPKVVGVIEGVHSRKARLIINVVVQF